MFVPEGAVVVKAVSAGDMMKAVKKYFNKADIIIGAAAVGDFTAKKADGKIKRLSTGGLDLKLEPTADIIAWAGKHKGKRTVMGFAAEAGDLKQEARRKLRSKNLDFIVFNDVTRKDAGFNSDNNEITVISAGGRVVYEGRGSKKELAETIIDIAEGGKNR